jgi:hypothetical protein
MGFTIGEGRRIARTAKTIDQVYADRPALGNEGGEDTGLLILSQMAAHGHMKIITATY